MSFNFLDNNNKKEKNWREEHIKKYYENLKEDIKRANIMFPSMKDMKKGQKEIELEEYEQSQKYPKPKKPSSRDENDEMGKIADILYPTMGNKNETEEEKKKNNSSKLENINFERSELSPLLKTYSKPKEKEEEKENKSDLDLFKKEEKQTKEPSNNPETPKLKGYVSKMENQGEINNRTYESNNKIKNKEINNIVSSYETKEKAKEFIQKLEGFRGDAYKDTGGVWTIGYGHTNNVKPGDKVTKEEAGKLFVEDFNHHSEPLKHVKVELSNNEKIALISFIYNVGVNAFKNSTLLKKLNQGDKKGAANEFDKWIYDNGKINRGLINRRADEKKKFLTPDD